MDPHEFVEFRKEQCKKWEDYVKKHNNAETAAAWTCPPITKPARDKTSPQAKVKESDRDDPCQPWFVATVVGWEDDGSVSVRSRTGDLYELPSTLVSNDMTSALLESTDDDGGTASDALGNSEYRRSFGKRSSDADRSPGAPCFQQTQDTASNSIRGSDVYVQTHKNKTVQWDVGQFSIAFHRMPIGAILSLKKRTDDASSPIPGAGAGAGVGVGGLPVTSSSPPNPAVLVEDLRPYAPQLRVETAVQVPELSQCTAVTEDVEVTRDQLDACSNEQNKDACVLVARTPPECWDHHECPHEYELGNACTGHAEHKRCAIHVEPGASGGAAGRHVCATVRSPSLES